jgi:hypothetical protein
MQSPEFAKTVLFQFPPGVQPVIGYEQATAPGVVEFDSNKEVLLIGITNRQFPSVMERSCTGMEVLGSLLL